MYPSQHFPFGAAFVCQAGNFWTHPQMNGFIQYTRLLMFVVVQLRAVAQLGETLRYEPEGRWFDSRWCRWNFSLT